MVILKINYTTSLDRAARSVRYHAFRSRESELDRKGIFDRSSDNADVRRFIAGLDDPLTRDWKTRGGRVVTPPKMHRLIYSLRRRDFETCGFTSWKPIIREAVNRVEQQQRIRLDWVAAEHLSSTHPHVHVDIKSVYTAPDGTRHRLKIRHDLRVHLKKAVEEIVQRELERVREERRREREMGRAVHEITVGLARLLREAGREETVPYQGSTAPPRRRKLRDEHDRDDRGR